MIDFDLKKAEATKERLGTLSDTAQKQHSEVMMTYSSIKSKLMNKLSAVKRDISTAESEKNKAQGVLAHNKEVEHRTRIQIQEAKDDIERYERDKEKAEKDLKKAEDKLSVAQALQNFQSQQGGSSSSASSAVSQLQSKISSLESKIRSLDESIRKKREEIEKLEKKLQIIEKANNNLEKIIRSIDNSLKQLRTLVKQIEVTKSQMERHHEIYDGKYGQTRRGMEAVHNRVASAIKAGENALYDLQKAGCGSEKHITVDSPSTISRIATEIKSSATKIGFSTDDLKREADRFRGYLKDRVTEDVKNTTAKIGSDCKNQSGVWEDKALSLQNAASHLEWYLGFAM